MIENYRKVDFKKLAQVIVEASKSEIGSASQQTGDLGKRCYYRSNLKAVWRQNSFFRDLNSFLLSPPTDSVRPTHILRDNLLYSKSADSNVLSSKNTFTATSNIQHQVNFMGQLIGPRCTEFWANTSFT